MWVISWRNTSHWVRGNKGDVICVVKVKTVRRCGGFKENGSRGSSTIRRCMTVEVGFEVSYAQDTVHCISWLPVACMNELSQLQHHVYLQTPMLPSVRIMDWTSESLRDFALCDINKHMWATAQLFFLVWMWQFFPEVHVPTFGSQMELLFWGVVEQLSMGPILQMQANKDGSYRWQPVPPLFLLSDSWSF